MERINRAQTGAFLELAELYEQVHPYHDLAGLIKELIVILTWNKIVSNVYGTSIWSKVAIMMASRIPRS